MKFLALFLLLVFYFWEKWGDKKDEICPVMAKHVMSQNKFSMEFLKRDSRNLSSAATTSEKEESFSTEFWQMELSFQIECLK